MVNESVGIELVSKDFRELQLLKKYNRGRAIVAMMGILFFMIGYFVITLNVFISFISKRSIEESEVT